MVETLRGVDAEVDISQLVNPYDDTDDGKNHLTHIVNPPKNVHVWHPGMSAVELVQRARLIGAEIIALCDYKWVPKRNPEKYPVCQVCVDIAGELMREAGE